MNPLLNEASASVGMGWLLGVMTVVFFAIFLGWVWYAWSPGNRHIMDEAAQLPFTEGGES